MGLDELHPFCESEVAKTPQKPGVYVLFQIQIPLHVDGARNLRSALRAARRTYPAASHFSIEILGMNALPPRLQQLKKDLGRTRKLGFVGTAE